jgi:hypothetical protein
MFQEKKYQVIKQALPYELANFIFNYFLLKRDAVGFMYQNNIHSESPILGTWGDTQIPNTFSCYGDFVMDTLLVKMLPVMKEHTNLDLIPTYSYARAYKRGDKLRRHKDRPSCEISTTLNLGGDPWPIYYIDGTGARFMLLMNIKKYINLMLQQVLKVLLEVGDMLVYIVAVNSNIGESLLTGTFAAKYSYIIIM